MFETTNETTVAEAPEGERQEFHIDSAERADWLLKKLAAIESERALIRAQAAQMIGQLDADEKGLRDRFEAELREWGRAELLRRGGRRKSLPLFHGTLTYRSVPPSLRVDDVAAALNRAVEMGAVKVDAAGYRAAALAALKDSGELFPGVEIVPEREHFGIRFGKDSGEGEGFGG